MTAPALRAIDARFVRDGVELVPALSLSVEAGDTLELCLPTRRAASIAARMCAAIVKPSEGTIYVGEYETRLQPPQAKRLVGFVDVAGFAGNAYAFRCEAAFRADAWRIDAAAAQARARELALAAGDDGYARAIALALIADVALVVLDQPASRYVDAARRLAPLAGIVHTRVAIQPAVSHALPLAHAIP